jgi:two-component system invasion response regulator UvrY
MTTLSVTRLAIVDDHPMLRWLLKAYVESAESGCTTVVEAEDGRSFMQAISELSETELPQLVLLDVNMPGIDGYQTIRWLRQNHPGVRIVVLSMFDDTQTILRCLRLGAHAYLFKNARADELLFTIRRVMEIGEYISPAIGSVAVAGLKESPTAVNKESRLTPKEVEFLRLACQELTYKEIAIRMCISTRTVDIYRDRLFEKLKVRSRVAMVLYAINNALAGK